MSFFSWWGQSSQPSSSNFQGMGGDTMYSAMNAPDSDSSKSIQENNPPNVGTGPRRNSSLSTVHTSDISLQSIHVNNSNSNITSGNNNAGDAGNIGHLVHNTSIQNSSASGTSNVGSWYSQYISSFSSNKSTTSFTPSTYSNEFLSFVKFISESSNKKSEEELMNGTLCYLKENLQTSDVSNPKNAENILQLLYCEMLGYNAEFGYLAAINSASSDDFNMKRIGYLFVNHFMPTNHELTVMMIGTLQKDLQSSNYLVVDLALRVVCRLVTAGSLPAVESQVRRLFHHHKPCIRKKAIMTMLKLYEVRIKASETGNPTRTRKQLDISLLSLCQEALGDSDPQVMNAGVIVLHELLSKHNLINTHTSEINALIPGIISIITQISENRLGSSYLYHGIPAPWIQIRILKCLAILGASTKKAATQMYGILMELAKRSDNGNQTGYAVLYEVIRCICLIYPNEGCLKEARDYIEAIFKTATERSRPEYSSSDHHLAANIKFTGLQLLCNLVKVKPEFTPKFQPYIVSALESKDDTLLKKALDLLFSMTNRKNANTILSKMISVLSTTIDQYFSQELTSKIFWLAEKYAKDRYSFLDVATEVLRLRHAPVQSEHIQLTLSVMQGKLLAPAVEDDELEFIQSRIVETFFDDSISSSEYQLSNAYLEVIIRSFGVCANSSKKYTREDLLLRLCDFAEKKLDSSLQSIIVQSMIHIILSTQDENEMDSLLENPQLNSILLKFCNSSSCDVQQRCYEFLNLKQHAKEHLKDYFLGPSTIHVDPQLKFVEKFVEESGGEVYDHALRATIRSALPSDGIQISDKLKIEIQAKHSTTNSDDSDSTPTLVIEDSKKLLFPDDIIVKPSTNIWGEEVEEIVTITKTQKSISPTEKDIISSNFRVSKFVDETLSDYSGSQSFDSEESTRRKKQWKSLFELDQDFERSKHKPVSIISTTYTSTSNRKTTSTNPWDDDFDVVNSNKNEDAIHDLISRNKKRYLQNKKLSNPKQNPPFLVASSLRKQDSNDVISTEQNSDQFLMPHQAKYNPNVYTQHVQRKMAEYPPKPQALNVCAEDKEIAVKFYKVWKPKSLDIVFQIQTKNRPLHHVQMLAEFPENLHGVMEGDPKVVQCHNSTANIQSLVNSKQETTIHITFTLKNLIFDTNFVGRIHYQTESNPGIFQSAMFDISIDVMDILREEIQYDVSRFSKEWNELLCERQLKVLRQQSISETISKLEMLHLHPVEVKENEIIAVTRILNLDERCLIHIKVTEDMVHYVSKCNSKYIMDAFILSIERRSKI